jgi:Tol biopolymer transport system component
MRKMIIIGFGALLMLGLVTGAAGAADQTINWVSVSEDRTSNGAFGPIAVSDDGRFVAFTSGAQLVPGYAGGTDNVYVKDMQTGAVEIASVSSDGTQGDAVSGASVDMSNDGRYVVYTSEADNLVGGPPNVATEVYIHDRDTAETSRVPRDDGGQGANAGGAAISGDGRYVIFDGTGYLAAEPAETGLFIYDRVAGTTELVSAGPIANGAISDDGRHVAFTSREFDTNDDIILYDRQTDTWEIANPRIGGAAAITRQNGVSISGDGRFVAFGSPDDNYVPGDPADTFDVFVYDSESDTLELIPAGGTTGTSWTRPALSDDGRHVVFNGYGDLYGAANGQQDVVLYDRQDGVGEVVSIHNDGTPGDRQSGSYLAQPAISSDGRFVAFTTDVGFNPADLSGFDGYIVDREGLTGDPGQCIHDFADVSSSNIFEGDICWLAQQGITQGCAAQLFCPGDNVTRGQMAAFLNRALGLGAASTDYFSDDGGSVFEDDINRLAESGITQGCTADSFCPNDQVTRGQMAAFLRRGLALGPASTDYFTDDGGSVFEDDINRLAESGITLGCETGLFCPNDQVTRQQMAAFLRRGLAG